MKVAGSIDTNALLRLIINDVPDQSKAMVQLLMQAGVFYVEDIAIIETAFVMDRYYSIPRKGIEYAMSTLLEHKKLIINQMLLRGAMGLYINHPAFSIEDCFLTTYASLKKATPLWTFDKKLALQSPSAQEIKL